MAHQNHIIWARQMRGAATKRTAAPWPTLWDYRFVGRDQVLDARPPGTTDPDVFRTMAKAGIRELRPQYSRGDLAGIRLVVATGARGVADARTLGRQLQTLG